MSEHTNVNDRRPASAPGKPDWTRGMLRIDLSGATALVTFDRAEKLNALNRAFWADLRDGLE